MRVTPYQPCSLLQPYIRQYLLIDCAQESVNRILPSTGLTLALRYRGHVEGLSGKNTGLLPQNMLSGIQAAARLLRYAPGSGNVLVLFREAGAAAFFQQPLQELFGATSPLDDLVPREAAITLGDRLASAANDHQRIRLVEQFLTARLLQHKPDPVVAEALNRIHAAAGTLKIKALAASLYISQDAFEKRFRKAIGAAPKQYSTLVRMRAVVAAGNKGKTFTDIAFTAGYAGQPHFNKDFRSFTGQSPTDFFQAPPRW